MSLKMAKNDPTLAPSSGRVFELIEQCYSLFHNLVLSKSNSKTASTNSFRGSQEVVLHLTPVETRFRQ